MTIFDNPSSPKRPRLLDLYCKAGGAAMGYHRAGAEVVGVDHLPQPRYPFEFHQADALWFVERYGHEFDAIHASPPCQRFCALAAINAHLGNERPDLIAATRSSLMATGRPFVIENVPGAPLHAPVRLCGSAFGLRVRRHRLFESNMALSGTVCRHKDQGRPVGVYGDLKSTPMKPRKGGGSFVRAHSLAEGHAAMGIDWMTWKELTQAIPPAYTFFVGTQLLTALEAAA